MAQRLKREDNNGELISVEHKRPLDDLIKREYDDEGGADTFRITEASIIG